MIWIVSIAAAASTGCALYLYAVNRTLDQGSVRHMLAHRTMMERFNRTSEVSMLKPAMRCKPFAAIATSRTSAPIGSSIATPAPKRRAKAERL